MTPLYVSIPVLVWLFVCAWFDWKSRRVSNWLTLPALAVAVVVRVSGFGTRDWRFVCLLAMLVLMGWAANLVGGADAKANLVINLLDPRLVVWSWAGMIVWYFVLISSSRSREKLYPLPGMMGYTIGTFANVCLNMVSLEVK